MMDFDWTISIGNILTAMSAMIGVAIVFLRLHRALEDRIMSTHRELERQIFLVDTKIDRKIGGRNEDPPLTQQVAI